VITQVFVENCLPKITWVSVSWSFLRTMIPSKIYGGACIEIACLTLGDAEKESVESLFSMSSDPVTACTIQMGYRGQFPDWTKSHVSVVCRRMRREHSGSIPH